MTSDQFTPSARVQSHGEPISVRDLLSSGIQLYWDEAVAIVQEMCAVAIAGSGDLALVPDPADILFDKNGWIALRGRRGEKSPAAAGRMLHQLVATATAVPVPVRLFITQSASSDTYRSLSAFTEGLAYFSRMDRAPLIAEVYRRYHDRSSSREAMPTALSPAQATGEGDQGPPKPSLRQRVVRVALVLSVLSATILATWTWLNVQTRAEVGETVTQLLARAGVVVAELKQQLEETLLPSAETPPPPDEHPATPAPSRRSARRASHAGPVADDSAAPSLLERKAMAGGSDQLSLAAAIPAPVAPETLVSDPGPVVETVRDERLYSRADADVVPPVLLAPELSLPSTAKGGAGTRVNRMVVDVSPDGTVERVQLVEGPARMPDVMLLSGAKAWRFSPASRNGSPVRYRTVVSWVAVP